MQARCHSHMRSQPLQVSLLNTGVGIFIAANSVFIVHTSEMTQFAAF